MADFYRARPVIVRAIQLRETGTDQWDEVAEFLGLDPNSGRGEHATMRRPRRGVPGFVIVTLHAPGSGDAVMNAYCGDWLVRDRADRYAVVQAGQFPEAFASVDVDRDARDLYMRSGLSRETNGWDYLTDADRDHFRQQITEEITRAAAG